MTTLQGIIALILAPTTIVAILAYLLTKFFEQVLSKDVQNFTTRLQYESEQSKIRLENEFQIKLFEHQTKFSLFYNKRAEVISNLYSLLYDANISISELVNPSPHNNRDDTHERIAKSASIYYKFIDYYGKHRIFLNEIVCQKIDALIEVLRNAFENYRLVSNTTGINDNDPAHTRQVWVNAWLSMKEEVPPIQRELEQLFRQDLFSEAPVLH